MYRLTALTAAAASLLAVSACTGNSGAARAGASSAATPATSASPREVPVSRPPERPLPPLTPATPAGQAPATRGPDVPVVALRGTDLLVPGGRLLRVGAATGLDSQLCPAYAAASPDRKWVAYPARGGRLRAVDIRTRRVWDLGLGCAPAWGRGGLAYLVASSPAPDGSYRSELVVRSTATAGPQVWATGQLSPPDWAGASVVLVSSAQPGNSVQQSGNSAQRFGLLIADGPQRSRAVQPAGPELSTRFVAADPGGSRMLVQVDRPDGPYQRAFLRLIDTATLRVLSEFRVAGFEGAERGAWTGSAVVFGNGYADGESAHPPPLLVRLDASGDRLRVAKIVNLAAPDEDVIFNTVPRVVRSDEAGVVAVFRARPALRELLTCDAAALRCDGAIHLG